KSSHVQVSIEDDVRTGSSPDCCCFLLVGRQGSVCELVIHRGHPAVYVPDSVYVEDPGGLLDARAG
ncbi:hypothetical protein A2U01_0118725, partial [Trifolium medium]|nr:hypothetical protein [Trifolium medium]